MARPKPAVPYFERWRVGGCDGTDATIDLSATMGRRSESVARGQMARGSDMLITILVVLLILWLLGAFPRAGAYNANWGYAPIGAGTIIIIIVIIVLLSQGY
jgi:hypothetical protein